MTTNPMKVSEVKDQNILVDTNIVIYYAANGFKERSGNILRTLANNGNKIGISEITAFELLHDEQKNEVEDYFYKFVNYIHRVPVEQGCLQNAVALAELYRVVCNNKKVPDNDLIIGGTAIHYDEVLLLTTDRKDFCEPLWDTYARDNIYYKEEGDVEVTLYLLRFNKEVIKLQK